LHGPPRNLQEGRASHGSIAPGIDNSETATDLRSLCRPAPGWPGPRSMTSPDAWPRSGHRRWLAL